MESVIATVSGYHGSERFNLIKLIPHAGASYVGAMSPSITHLVCRKFEGRKYDLAMKFGTKVVNHRWVEDCIKHGKHVPEDPYMLQSGEDVGPLVMEVPVVAEADGLSKKGKVLSERSTIRGNCGKEVFDAGYGGSDLSAWMKSPLLDENLFPLLGTSSGGCHKLKSKSVRASKEENWSSSVKCFQETPLSELGRKEHEPSSPMHSLRGKRKSSKKEESNSQSFMQSLKNGKNIYNSTEGSYLAGSSCRRRLIKKNVQRDILESELSDSLPDCCQTSAPKQYNKVIALSNHSLDERVISVSAIEGTSHCNFSMSRSIIDVDEDIKEGSVWSPSPVSKNLSSSAKDAVSSCKRILQQGCSNAENINVNSRDVDQTEHGTTLPPSKELSCVICWTEFSQTRGVLPCGHRFCYDCIQDWAGRMTASRKASTCPLCKAGFVSITKVEDAASIDQKIYSQTIPCSTSIVDVFFLPDPERPSFGAQSLAPICCKCRSREPADMLISCNLCQLRKIHSYCLDPYLLPWTCIHCKDLPRTF
ncbi:hypothetical protein SLA2020_085420 [Shorea laevis]